MRFPTTLFQATRQPLHAAVLLLCLLASVPVSAGQSFASGDERVALLELYTSEGCSSCPPADRWFSDLKARRGLWEDFVPVAFHVDYWDYIGWKDRFSRPEFGERQRRYARENGDAVVYTPGVMLNGEEWRLWRSSDAAIASGKERSGELTLDHGTRSVNVQFRPVVANDDLVVTVAWLAFDRESEVTAGENRGRVLENDFVVLRTATRDLQPDGETFRASIETPADLDPAGRRAVAAWVSTSERQAPLQAVGGWVTPTR